MLVWDWQDGYALLSGGVEPAGEGDLLASDWEFVHGAWTDLADSPPTDGYSGNYLGYASAASSGDSGQLALYGGLGLSFDATTVCDSNATSDYSAGVWSPLTTFGPSWRDGAAMAWESQSQLMVLFGGTGLSCLPDGGWIDDDTWVLGTWPVATAPFSVSVTSSPSPPDVPAAPANVSFVATPNGGTPPYEFQWVFGLTAESNTPNLWANTTGVDPENWIFPDSGNYWVVVLVSDANGWWASANLSYSVGTWMVPNWLPPRDTYWFNNFPNPWDGGNCYGFTSTEMLYWENYELGETYQPYLPSAVPVTSLLYVPGGSAGLDDSTMEMNATQLAILLHQNQDTTDATNPANYLSTNLPGDQATLYAHLQEGLPTYIDLGTNDVHAVIVYGEQVWPNGTAELDISDPDVPGVTSHAWYDPTTEQFFYSNPGATWHEYALSNNGEPEPLQASWFNGFDSVVLPDQSTYYYQNGWLGTGWDLVEASSPVTVALTGTIGTFEDSFGVTGDSQSFVQGIPDTYGISEGSVQVYALYGEGYSVADPASGSSTVQIERLESANGTGTLQGYDVTVSSAAEHDFTLQPSSSGTTLKIGATGVSVNVSFFERAGVHSYLLNATGLGIQPNTTLDFSVSNWTGLNSSKHSSVTVDVQPSNGSSPGMDYHLANNQSGLGPGTPIPTSSGSPGLWSLLMQYEWWILLATVLVAAVVVAAYAVKRGRGPG